MFKAYRQNTRRRKAMEAFARGAYAEAKEYFAAILRDEGERAGHLFNLGLSHLALDEYAEAEGYLLRELELFGEHYPRLKTLGDLYFLWGRSEDARRYYERAIAEDTDGDGAKIVRRRIEICGEDCAFVAAMDSLQSYRDGVREMIDKNTEAALQAFSRAVEQDESNIHAWNNIGVIRLNRKENDDIERAIDAFERALSWQEVRSFRENLERARIARSRQQKSRNKGRSR